MLTIARCASEANSVEHIAVIRLSLKPALLSPFWLKISAFLSIARRPASSRVDHLGRFAEILRTDRFCCDHAECLRLLVAVVVKTVNRAAWNAECLPGPTSIGFPSTIQVNTPLTP